MDAGRSLAAIDYQIETRAAARASQRRYSSRLQLRQKLRCFGRAMLKHPMEELALFGRERSRGMHPRIIPARQPGQAIPGLLCLAGCRWDQLGGSVDAARMSASCVASQRKS